VALGVALRAEKVEFYKDVEGIYTQDPKNHPEAHLYTQMTYDDALLLLLNGAKVLHPRCVCLAKKNHLPLHVISFLHPSVKEEGDLLKAGGTWIGDFADISKERECLYEDEIETGCVHV